MRAVLCSAFTGPEDLRVGEIEEPRPASDEILIDVHAASVSFMDHLLVSGRYQMRPSTSFVPGTEPAGGPWLVRVGLQSTAKCSSAAPDGDKLTRRRRKLSRARQNPQRKSHPIVSAAADGRCPW